MAKPPSAALALPKLEKDEKVLDVRLRLRGRAAIDLVEYQRVFEEVHGESYETEAVIAHILNTFIERDKAFQSRRKALEPAPAAR